ncbi:MAG TPA: hypothetical protein VK204_16685 [Nocardioidaceae bacterium]|jgi:Na+-translocating ferredoxin:NAD+ oxidoreductase RnfE subunit|nr:hypothetical protein [Nocardioidaceae bacterium]
MGSAIVVPMHLGNLHPYETALLVLLAFGPFVVLAVVVAVLRRRDADDETSGEGRPQGSGSAEARQHG